MTVQTETDRSGPYAGAGTTGPFPVDFRFLADNHLQVIKTSTLGVDTTLELTTDYSVSGAGGETGEVTTVAPVLSGEKLTILRNVPFTQEADYVDGDDFPAESHERALDLLTMQTQQVKELAGRALTLPPTVSGASTELPSPEANKLVGWDSTGTRLQNMDAGTLATIVAFGTAIPQVFTGDGVWTQQNLAHNPGALGNLDIAIGGVTQTPGVDYTWAGGTLLTFSSPPPSGQLVLVRYIQGLPQGVSDSASSAFVQSGAGAVSRSAQDKMRDHVSVLDYGTLTEIQTDATAAIQRAHDALPATGGVIEFPPVVEYMLAVSGVWVNISKPNVTLLGPGAWVVSPNSSDAEIKTGSSYINGFRVTADNCVISVNMRGPAVAWVPGSATDCLSVRDMTFKNMYNSAVSMQGTLGCDTLTATNVVFDTSRDLTSDAGNYECLSRSSASTDPQMRLVRVDRCTFRSVSGAIDVHNVRDVVVSGGTQFIGVDINCIKVTTSNFGVVTQNLTVDDSVIFDGAAVNSGSANRHIACRGSGRGVDGYTWYIGFIQVFNNIQWHGRAKNSQNYGVAFLDGSRIDAVLNFDRSRWDGVANAIVDAQGTVSIQDAELINSNVLHTSISSLRAFNMRRCRMRDSYVALTKKAAAAGAPYFICDNLIDYSVNNLGALRLVNYGTDSAPAVLIDGNTINITGGGNTLAIDGSSSGNRAWIGPNNTLSSGATVVGRFLTAYEPTTASGYVGGLPLPFKRGEMTVVNTNAAGTIIYVVTDATSAYLPVGTEFHVCKTNSARDLYVSCTGGINGSNSAQAVSAYASATFRKIAADKWIMVNISGTWTMA